MAVLNKENIKNLLKTKDVNIPEWDCEVRIKQMSIQEQLDVEALNKEGVEGSEVIYNILRFCCLDDQGGSLFDTKEDVKSMPANGVVSLFKECLVFNGIAENELDVKAKN